MNLFIGTISDNNSDMMAKGRNAKGEKIPNAKLTSDMIPRIRAARKYGESLAHIGRSFGVHAVTVFDIVHGKTWSHIS